MVTVIEGELPLPALGLLEVSQLEPRLSKISAFAKCFSIRNLT